jgi:delta-lactam-biosynthetic de-N-acetylase
MARKIVTLLAATLFLLAGCGAQTGGNQPSAGQGTTEVTTPAPAAQSPDASTPGSSTGAGQQPVGTTQPGTGESGTAQPGSSTGAGQQPSGTTQPGTGESGTAQPSAGAQPAQSGTISSNPIRAARWYPRDIGYPLTTDDEQAKGAKVVMLTFDDGPTKDVTPKILDILKENDVPAVFFVTGYGAKNEDVLKRIHAEGHVIGTHTMNHDNLREMTEEQARREIVGVNQMVERILGFKPRLFRPPFGAYNDTVLKILREEHMEIVNWSDGSKDWEGVVNGRKDPARIVQDVMDQLHPGAIILFHDTHMHTAEALPEIIKQLRTKGYEFVVMHD